MSSENPIPVPRTGVPLGITDPVESARAELKAALAAIEEKGNLPKRAARAGKRFTTRAREFARQSPQGAVAAAVGVAATVGGVVWLAVRSYSR